MPVIICMLMTIRIVAFLRLHIPPTHNCYGCCLLIIVLSFTFAFVDDDVVVVVVIGPPNWEQPGVMDWPADAVTAYTASHKIRAPCATCTGKAVPSPCMLSTAAAVAGKTATAPRRGSRTLRISALLRTFVR